MTVHVGVRRGVREALLDSLRAFLQGHESTRRKREERARCAPGPRTQRRFERARTPRL